jgi:hypothetical protein
MLLTPDLVAQDGDTLILAVDNGSTDVVGDVLSGDHS